ncbi:MAG: leucine-rich repeat domain-containing protein, partial [Eubacteriaceae bacterium]
MKIKKWLCLLMSVMLLIASFPSGVLAESVEKTEIITDSSNEIINNSDTYPEESAVSDATDIEVEVESQESSEIETDSFDDELQVEMTEIEDTSIAEDVQTESTTISTENNFEYYETAGGVAIDGYVGNESSITIPNTLGGKAVVTIGSSAFYDCSNLESVTLNEGLKTIGIQAFYNCDSLESITIPDSVQTIDGESYYGGAFEGCNSLKIVEIGSGLTTI